MTPEPNNDTLVVTRVANGWTVQPANSPLAVHTHVFISAAMLARHIMSIADTQDESFSASARTPPAPQEETDTYGWSSCDG
jgi:hypothetical protein